MKKIKAIITEPERHWVGDGFPVRTVFSYNDERVKDFNPFLLLDYAGPAEFSPSAKPRGVGEHPHRGFETVTIVYQGEVEHRDSSGAGGRIGPGDVQWMTAASGVVHEEMHSRKFTRAGGTIEMIQLWVNLPAKFKMSPPRYQELPSGRIPVRDLPEGSGNLRVIAGAFGGLQGPAQTFTPVNLWDLRLKVKRRAKLVVPAGYTTAVFVLKGKVVAGGSDRVGAAELALFEPEGEEIALEAQEDAVILLLNGQPIDEPIAAYGPFVMNTQPEIRRAIEDYESGRMGKIV